MALLGQRQYVHSRALGQNLGTGDTTLIEMQATEYGRIDSIVANNPSGGALLLTLNIRRAGAAAATTNQYVSVVSIASHGSLSVAAGPILEPGDIVSGKGDSAGLNVWVGVELTSAPPAIQR